MVKSMSLRERWSARGRASTVRNGEPAQQRGERASRDAVRACSAVGQADNAKPEEEEWAMVRAIGGATAGGASPAG